MRECSPCCASADRSTSSVGKHASTGTLATAQALVIAVGKPVVAAVVERLGHGRTFLLVGATYLLGYALVGTASSFAPIYAGSVVYAAGYTALQILLALLVADATSLRYRGLSNALLAAPFLVNVAASAQLLGWVLPDWRRGYALLALLVPLSLLPVALVLRRAPAPSARQDTKKDMDWLGIVLGGLGLTLLLLTPYHVLGAVLCALFAWHEATAPHPLVPVALLRNPPVLAAALIGAADFASFYLQFVYLYPFLLVVTDWSPRRATYALYTHAFAITVFGLLAGAVLHSTRRFKPTLLSGLLIRLAGVLLMFPAVRHPISAGVLVVAQILQGWGGGFASIAAQVSAQASTADVAGATAFVLLAAELGNCLGSAAATSVWNSHLPHALAEFVPGADMNRTLVEELFGSVSAILELDAADPVRIGAAAAYEAVMTRLLCYAAALAVVPPLLCVFMTRDVRLGDHVDGQDQGDALRDDAFRPGSGSELRSEFRARTADADVNERTPLVSPATSRPATRPASPS